MRIRQLSHVSLSPQSVRRAPRWARASSNAYGRELILHLSHMSSSNVGKRQEGGGRDPDSRTVLYMCCCRGVQRRRLLISDTEVELEYKGRNKRK
jgi:hypothetical protein